MFFCQVTVCTISPQVLKKYLTGGFCGFDKDGRPVRVELYGLLDMRGLMHSCKKSDFEKYKLWQCAGYEKIMREQSAKVNWLIDWLIKWVHLAAASEMYVTFDPWMT